MRRQSPQAAVNDFYASVCGHDQSLRAVSDCAFAKTRGLCVSVVLSTRIDVLRVGEMLEGFEIKSDFDTLIRLSQQAEVYSQSRRWSDNGR